MFEQQVYSNSFTTATSFNLSPSANTVTGRLLILVISIGSSRTVSSVSDTHGHTWSIDAPSGGTRSVNIATTTVVTPITTANTITVNLSGTSTAVILAAEFSGMAFSPFDKFSGNSGNSLTTLATGSTGTLTQANQLVIVSIGWAASTGTITASPSGYTALTSALATTQARYKTVSATTALNESWTWTNSVNSGAVVATYKLATAATFVPKVVFM